MSTTAAAILMILAMTPAQAAAPTPSVPDALIFSQADAKTRAIAAAEPEALRATANLCGSGYQLSTADRLPEPNRRLGTLFLYSKSTASTIYVCALFDNNTGSSKYMKLKLCPNRAGATCPTDEGNFSRYAGPVRISGDYRYVGCSTVTAIMKNSKSSSAALIDRVTGAYTCNR
ncbi:hypothetical protein [Streptomyces gobiensis]|uniref:hypothetical protein n=1 Tax=Streptomyces gobiensis TaxID=2875706 RepID=UPI001E3D4B6E|nr:hypothetical protein [Streptomyces gobiensis]UGY91682.1 hypothetical protein test1122_08055 [Streptomyces gobiensis]